MVLEWREYILKQLIAFGSIMLGIFLAGSWKIKKENLKQDIRNINRSQLGLYIFNIVVLFISIVVIVGGLYKNHQFVSHYKKNGILLQGKILEQSPGNYRGTLTGNNEYRLEIVYNGIKREVYSWSENRYYENDTVDIYYIPTDSENTAYVMLCNEGNSYAGEKKITIGLYILALALAIWVWRYGGAILS